MQLTETKDKSFTVSVNGTTIHSKYSPLKEAEKFVNQHINGTGTIIILGAGLGYIFNVLEDKYPNANVISIPYNHDLGKHSLQINSNPRKQWDGSISINKFFQSVINETNIKGLQVAEWHPTATVFSKEATVVNRALITTIRRINGNLLTTARFGQLWLTNSIRNYIGIDTYISDIKIDRPIVIVASGKSLGNAIEVIKKHRDQITLISLSSANMALDHNNLTADITFSTDPGYYSKLHIKGYEGLISMPLSNSTSERNPVLLINQGNFFENELIELGNLPNINLGENGTVAGTALMFALKQSSQRVFLVGQDLQSADLESHIKPYTFDNILQLESDKTNPYYSIKFKRWIDEGVTYKTYRDWFTLTAKKNKDRIYRLESDSDIIEGIKDIKSGQLSHYLKGMNKPPISYLIKTNKTKKVRQKQCIDLLNNWLKRVQSEKIEENTLFYLISTSSYTDANNKALSDVELKKNIQCCKEESNLFIKRLLALYGRQLL